MALRADALRAEAIDGTGEVDIDRDRALVLRYQQGDEAAFDELYRRYYSRLRAYCRRRVGDDFIAEELAQEAFVRALRAMPGFAGDRRFYPWMTVIAQRLCVDHHRLASRTEPAADFEDDGDLDAGFDGVLDESDHAQLAVAMARLAPRHREALRLREEEGQSYQAMAAHLAVPVTTVEALLHRARKSLRREFLAISGGGRLASLPVLGVAFAAAGRLRTRAAAKLAPAAGVLPGASAGVAALTMAAVPALSWFAVPAAAQPAPPAPAAAVTPAAIVPPVSTGGVVVPASVEVGGVAAAPVEPSTPPGAPQPELDLGATRVYTDPAGAEYAGDKAEAMPITVVLSPKLRIGLDLSPLLGSSPELHVKVP